MAILCGWASQDENGHAHGGKAGDQTGREVKVGYYYNFGQSVIIRCTNRQKAHKMANACKWICQDNHTGYDQYERTTLFNTLKSIGFSNYKKLKINVETDCSALMAVLGNIAGYNISKDIWTGNLKDAFVKTGDFKVLTAKKYFSENGAYLMKGDIILNPAAHVIMALESGSKASSYYGEYETLYRMNFRTGAGTTYSKICKIPKGTKIHGTVYGKNGWLYAFYNGKWGFCRLKSSSKTYCKKVK